MVTFSAIPKGNAKVSHVKIAEAVSQIKTDANVFSSRADAHPASPPKCAPPGGAYSRFISDKA
jgi:hypothetical protein